MPRGRAGTPISNARAMSGVNGMWPGITEGMDSRCSCTRAPLNGVYQVKVRDALCVNHGGPLELCLARMARWRQGVS